MITRLHFCLALFIGGALLAPVGARADAVVIIQGAPGEATYEGVFSEWTQRWATAAEPLHQVFLVRATGEADQTTISQLDQLRSILEDLTGNPPDRLWIVLIGHGTDDGRAAKFNLDGPDLNAEELDTWLEPIAVPTAVIHCGAASSRFVDYLSQPGRVIITATRSSSEVNFARFGEALSTSLAGTEGDFDKDGQTSLLEAFLRASRLTRQFYDGDGRLATEHALIDDNGDGRGTSADEFSEQGHLVQTDPDVDGLVASQWCLAPADEERWLTPELRDRRNQLEIALRALRARQAELSEDDYYAELEPILLEIAELYEGSDRE
jgi:hypothetical protein